jgi:hypothetical protein
MGRLKSFFAAQATIPSGNQQDEKLIFDTIYACYSQICLFFSVGNVQNQRP